MAQDNNNNNLSSVEESFNVAEFTSVLVNSVIYEEEISQLKEKINYLETENASLSITRDMHVACANKDREKDRNEIRALRQKLREIKLEQEELKSVCEENEIAFQEIEELKEKLNKQHNERLKLEETFKNSYTSELQQLKMAKQEMDQVLQRKKLELAMSLRKCKQFEDQVHTLKLRIQFLEKQAVERNEEKSPLKKVCLNEKYPCSSSATDNDNKENLISSAVKVDFSGLSFGSPFPAFNKKESFYSSDLKAVNKTYVDLAQPQGRIQMYDQAKIVKTAVSCSPKDEEDDGNENGRRNFNWSNQRNPPFLRVGLSKKSRVRRPLHDTN